MFRRRTMRRLRADLAALGCPVDNLTDAQIEEAVVMVAAVTRSGGITARQAIDAFEAVLPVPGPGFGTSMHGWLDADGTEHSEYAYPGYFATRKPSPVYADLLGWWRDPCIHCTRIDHGGMP